MEGRPVKYWTKEWYEEMQLVGFLVFPETREEWEEINGYYQAEGIDYLQMEKASVEGRKEMLLQHLPDFFHSYIHDGTLKTVFPSAELREMAKQWRQDYEERMRALALSYRSYYDSIRSQLPSGAVKLHEQSLHDARILSGRRTAADTLVLELDCRGAFHYMTNIRVTFSGVAHAELPNLEEQWWLYDELNAVDGGFELRVLLSSLDSFAISAADVTIEILGDA